MLAGEVYRRTRTEPFTRDFGVSAQIQPAAVSVMANIAEGFEKNNPREFGRYLDVSKGSLAEVRSHIYIASYIGYLADDRVRELFTLVDDAGKVIAGLRRSLAPATGDRAPGTS